MNKTDQEEGRIAAALAEVAVRCEALGVELKARLKGSAGGIAVLVLVDALLKRAHEALALLRTLHDASGSGQGVPGQGVSRPEAVAATPRTVSAEAEESKSATAPRGILDLDGATADVRRPAH